MYFIIYYIRFDSETLNLRLEQYSLRTEQYKYISSGIQRRIELGGSSWQKVLIKVKNADGVGVKMPSFASSFLKEKEVLLRPETPLRITSVKRKELPVATVLAGEDKFVYHTLIEAEIVK